jgi:hypothetical protein
LDRSQRRRAVERAHPLPIIQKTLSLPLLIKRILVHRDGYFFEGHKNTLMLSVGALPTSNYGFDESVLTKSDTLFKDM